MSQKSRQSLLLARDELLIAASRLAQRRSARPGNRFVTVVEHQQLAVTRRSEVSIRGQIRADAVYEIINPRKTRVLREM